MWGIAGLINSRNLATSMSIAVSGSEDLVSCLAQRVLTMHLLH
jgi:hypothetical protein